MQDRNVPGDDIVYNDLAEEILGYPPEQGYLTISNALQWRLQYARVISLGNSVQGLLIMNGKRIYGDYQTPIDLQKRFAII